MVTTLIYVHDPMCSWCWGFETVRQKLFNAVSGKMKICRLLGGLAPDSMLPMAETMKVSLQQTWHRIEHTIPGTRFNYEFWTDCAPRRSTYPSNRAVIAARLQDEKFDALMTLRIQQAYYLQARNPSDNATLIELAKEIGLDDEKFTNDLNSDSTQQMLGEEINMARSIGVTSYPSLMIEKNNLISPLKLDYINLEEMLLSIDKILKSSK